MGIGFQYPWASNTLIIPYFMSTYVIYTQCASKFREIRKYDLRITRQAIIWFRRSSCETFGWYSNPTTVTQTGRAILDYLVSRNVYLIGTAMTNRLDGVTGSFPQNTDMERGSPVSRRHDDGKACLVK
ncbi:hypothetical protein TNIN_232841 [Trichonephila inaurata madagascariensis]|uniref:Uncharacterized protein n=1 Tax=Trichonephila inaurata madagascariensis TaxID=2747483 RepID=A0A8X6WXX0_9ARAC|nr:hypothetical protein TNIN_232841 [Trichonephila inaurata madagascariensis]